MSLIKEIVNKIEQAKIDAVQEDKVEVVNELSQTTLKHYINKAVDDVSSHSFRAGESYATHVKGGKFTGSKEDGDEQLADDKKSFKRQKGIIAAANKMAKDDVKEGTTVHHNYEDWKNHAEELGASIMHRAEHGTELSQATIKGKKKPVGSFNHNSRTAPDGKIGTIFVRHNKVDEAVIESLRLVGKHANGNKMAKVYKDHEWQEHRVKFHTDGVHHTEADYHTNDAEDAHSTAKHWVGIKEETVVEAIPSGGYYVSVNKETHRIDHGPTTKPIAHKHRKASGGKNYVGVLGPDSKKKVGDSFKDVKESTLNELSQKTLKSYVDKANTDLKSKEATLDRTPMDQDVSDLAKKMNDRTNKMVDAKRKLPRGNPYDVVGEGDVTADMDQDVTGETDQDVTGEDGEEDIVSEATQLVERHLSTSEDDKKEEYVHAMKKNLSHFNKKYGKRGKSVMYAVATKMAKNESIDVDSLKAQLLIELSKKTLGNYIEKAVDDVDEKAYDAGTQEDDGTATGKHVHKLEKSIEKRKDGVKKAVKKITKEAKETEHGANLELAKTKDIKKGPLDDYLDHNDKATKKDKKITKEDVQLTEERASHTAALLFSFKHSPSVEKIVDPHYTSSGATALVRTNDGNAYEVIVTPAHLGQYHGDATKRDQYNKRKEPDRAKARSAWGWDTHPENPDSILPNEEE